MPRIIISSVNDAGNSDLPLIPRPGPCPPPVASPSRMCTRRAGETRIRRSPRRRFGNDLLLLGLGLVLRDDLLLHLRRHRLVMTQFHYEAALAAGHGF